MSSPTTDEDEIPDDLKTELDERACEVLEDGDSLTFEEHEDRRE